MKLGSTAALSLALAAGVSGFVPSLDRHAAIGGHRGTRTSSSDGGQLSVAAAPVDEAATAAASDDQQIEITDVNSVKALSFRQLQKACVARGLPAVGNTAALRSRLLESAGLPDVSAPSAPASAVNGSDDEVSPLATTKAKKQVAVSNRRDAYKSVMMTRIWRTFFIGIDVPMRNSKKHTTAEIPANARKHILLACIFMDCRIGSLHTC